MNDRQKPAEPEPVQPDLQFVIQALHEENAALNQNKLYLLAILKQAQSEFRDAQEMWQLEKASLTKTEE
jgi:hypothetical protein